MASYHKRGGGYSVRWRGLDGANRCRQVPDATTAKRLVQGIERAHGEGKEWRPEQGGHPTIREVFSDWLRDVERLRRPRTADAALIYLETFLTWADKRGVRDITAISRALLSDYHAYLLTSGQRGSRTATTARKHIEGVQVAWSWAFDHDEGTAWEGLVPRPRKLEMPKRVIPVTVAPTWAEMDLCLSACSDWWYRLALIQRALGTRLTETLLLEWRDVDLAGRWITMRSEATKGGYGGRVLPMPAFLARELAGWGIREGHVVGAPEAEFTGRGHAGRNLARAWRRAGVRPEVWRGHPTHALRKGVVSGLLGAGAQRDSVEYLVGHAFGAVRSAYLDPTVALSLRETVDMIPEPRRVLSLARGDV